MARPSVMLMLTLRVPAMSRGSDCKTRADWVAHTVQEAFKPNLLEDSYPCEKLQPQEPRSALQVFHRVIKSEPYRFLSRREFQVKSRRVGCADRCFFVCIQGISAVPPLRSTNCLASLSRRPRTGLVLRPRKETLTEAPNRVMLQLHHRP